MKAAFFDRDGTIVKDYPDEEWNHVQELEWITDALTTVKQIQDQGYKIIVITNQYLISEKFIDRACYEKLKQEFSDKLKNTGIDAEVYICEHARSSGCRCCKPGPGLVEQALNDFPRIELEDSFVVGDSWRDMAVAEYFGMRRYYVGEEVLEKSDRVIKTKIAELASLV